MKRHSAIVSFTEENFDLKNAALLKLAPSFIFTVNENVKPATFDVEKVSYR